MLFAIKRRLEGIGATRRVHHAFALMTSWVDVDLAVAGIGRARTAFLMARAISIYIWDVASVCQASLEGAGHVDHWRS